VFVGLIMWSTRDLVVLPSAGASRSQSKERPATMSLLFGYFDPGTGSLLLQLILGGTAGLLVFAKYLWERMPGIRGRKTDGSSGASSTGAS